jgi:hypothetical protein
MQSEPNIMGDENNTAKDLYSINDYYVRVNLYGVKIVHGGMK